MSITLQLSPGFEANLREEANRAGVDATTLVPSTLEKQFGKSDNAAREARLMEKINEGPPEKVWQGYHELAAKRDAETLTDPEHEELVELSEAIETIDVQRLTRIAELGQLRGISLSEIYRELGLPESRAHGKP